MGRPAKWQQPALLAILQSDAPAWAIAEVLGTTKAAIDQARHRVRATPPAGRRTSPRGGALDGLGPWIRSARKAHGMLAQELAERIGRTPELISHWERGVTPIPRAMLQRLEAILLSGEG